MEYNFYTSYVKFFMFSLLILLNKVQLIQSTNCTKSDRISNKACFNDVLIFDDDHWRAGHSALNKDGVFILEFSKDTESGDRAFYGLKPNGRYFFDEKPIKEITLPSKAYDGKTISARYESINSFVALKNDIDKTKEYLLSISTYFCYMEIFDFTKENEEYDAIYTYKYLGNPIFSFKFELLETNITNENIYYIVFSHHDGEAEYGEYISIKKIQFSNLNFNKDDIITSITYKQKLNDRTVSAFLVDDVNDNDLQVIVVIYENNRNPTRYNFNVYKLSDLTEKCKDKELFDNDLETTGKGDEGKGHGVYFKIIYLGKQDTAIVYFKSNFDDQHLFFQILTLIKDNSCNKFDSKIYMEIEESLKTDLLLNDFIKITDSRLAFVSTKGESSLFIILMDLYANNKNVQMRTYNYDISPYKMAKELAFHVYNGYLAFSSTISTNNMYSIFMIFGFGNGTDFTIDISPHLMDTGNYTEGNDLVTTLLKYLNIDNNIFGYIPIDKIILVSYPEELLFYDKDDQENPLPNGTIIDNTHILMQNRKLNKTHKLYYLEYQYMVKEPPYNEYKKFADRIIDERRDGSFSQYSDIFTQKTFYGRTNRLSFKLCHDFCETCNQFGLSIHYQKCYSCLEEYTYDYYTIIKHFTENCVPYDYLYDEDNHQIKLCNTTSYKYYYNASRNNERYCFNGIYDCPEEYHYFNETTHQCSNYTPPIPTTILTTIPTTIITTIPTTILTTIPTTILTTIITTIITTIPTTILTTIPTTIITTIPTTVSTTIPTTIITTILTTIPTTIMTTIATTIPTTILTTTPTTIATTIPTTISTTISTTIPTTILTTIPTTISSTIATTIPTTISTSILSTIPSTIISTFPTTILTTFMSTIPTTFITTIITTISTTILTTIITTTPTSIITTIPTTIHTTIFTTIPTTFPTTIPITLSKTNLPSSTIIIDKCVYGAVITESCVFINMTSNDIANKVKNEVLDTYPQDGINIVIPAPNDYAFQLTSTSNELNSLRERNDNSMSILNLGNCENILKQHHEIPNNASLIILKYEKLTGIGSEKSIQYEIYNPNSYEKLDLSICENKDIDIAIPININEEIENLYNDLKVQGYYLFDKNNKFYIDICTPFQADNNADILLTDRLYYFFSKVVNITNCPSNCKYSTFSIDTKYLTCQCEINNENIDLVNPDKFIGKVFYSMTDYVLKYTSYKTMKCYKLVFSFKHFIKNAGSIVLLLLLFTYVGFFIYFTLKRLSPLKLAISKIWFGEKNEENKLDPFLKIYSNIKKRPTENKSSKGNNPPKKQLILRRMLNKKELKKIEKKDEVTEDKKTEKKDILIDNPKVGSNQKKELNINLINNIATTDDLRSEDTLKNVGDININNIPIIKINDNNKSLSNKNIKEKNIKIDATGVKSFYKNMNLAKYKKLNFEKAVVRTLKSKISKKNVKNVKTKKNNSDDEKRKKVTFKDILESNSSLVKESKPKKGETILDDYELNHLGYFDALKLDKRNYCQIYFSILKRDQNIISTCFSCNDYNLFYVKVAKLIFIISNLMAMNAFLFADKSLHKLFISGVQYYFDYQILQIFLSIIITYFVEVILCFLTQTDRHIYEIKSLPKQDVNGNKIFGTLKYITNKLLIFYVTALIILIFYWYFISAFCAVYPNTQKIYIIDCLLSFIFFSIFPFILYAITTLLRIISLKCNNKKKLKCLYKVSQFFPLF